MQPHPLRHQILATITSASEGTRTATDDGEQIQ